MTCVTKHDTEEEGEGDDGVQSWIGLSICRYAIGIDQILETPSEFVGPVESRWIFVCVNDVQERRYGIATQSLKKKK